MTAARASTDSRDRLVVELLAVIGMRAGELADDLEAHAVELDEFLLAGAMEEDRV